MSFTQITLIWPDILAPGIPPPDETAASEPVITQTKEGL